MEIVRRPGLQRVLPGPSELRVVVRSADTNGAMAVIEQTLLPKTLIPPHTHANDVWVLVHAGQVGALVGDVIGEAGPGEWILKPRDVSHAMWNAGAEPARITEVLTPAGSEEWFEELAALADGDAAGFAEACTRHSITFHEDSPWTARLREQFSLS